MKEDDTSSIPACHLICFKNALITVHFLDFIHTLLFVVVNRGEILNEFIPDTLYIEMEKPEVIIFNLLYSIEHKQV